ncbi:hypothetical protein FF36_05778 [Frankia torreyi]|uniref:Uncharacterized protein n=1 Tax=Frankia torreyi TaxID=1856 RepID=A0A0D8B971_9ACTN|nr:hypothetical protein FF36_05778 [Frankia torreyi]KQM07501.1 hypothetical protein FF86_1003194 [Frankia sp. CpI1-P]
MTGFRRGELTDGGSAAPPGTPADGGFPVGGACVTALEPSPLAGAR